MGYTPFQVIFIVVVAMSHDETTRVNKRTPLPQGFWQDPVHFLALGLGTGYVPKLPGTAGTLVGVLLYFFMQPLDLIAYLVITTVLFVAGIGLCGRTARDLGVPDHSAIVWDEIVGYLIIMIMAPTGWPWMLAGFVLFRFFDIVKPWPISRVDKQLKNGFGIMLDDAIAGIYGLITLQIIVYML